MAPRHAARNNTLLPRYTCPLFNTDCGGGFCCPLGHTCSTSGSETTCRVAPGMLGSDQPAFTAAVATTSSSSSSSATSSSTSTSTSSTTTPASSSSSSAPSSTSSSPTAAATITITPTPTAIPSANDISGSGIAGIVIGFLLLAALIGGSIWSLVQRRRQELLREASLQPSGGTETDNGVAGFLGGGRAMEGQPPPPPPPPPQMSQSVGESSAGSRFGQWGGGWRLRLFQLERSGLDGGERGQGLGDAEAGRNVQGKERGEVLVGSPSSVMTRKEVGGENKGARVRDGGESGGEVI